MASLRTARRNGLRALNDPYQGYGQNQTTGLSIYDWAKMFSPGAQVIFRGGAYQAYTSQSAAGGAYGANPIVFACAIIRTALFSEARFQFQQLRAGKPGDLFGTPDLQILEEPFPGYTTSDLLIQAETDVRESGNSYWIKPDNFLLRLNAANVSLLTESVTERTITGQRIGERLSGYLYKPTQDPKSWTLFGPEEVAHFMPYVDPTDRFKGISWLSSCLPDVGVDDVVQAHKRSVIENGASLSTIVSFDPAVSPEQFDAWVARFRSQHEGAQNANKTLFLGAGADVKTVGQSFENLAIQSVQGASEVRICAASGVPAAIVGVSEGLKGSTLNAGNYGEARRRLTDVTMRPLWRQFAGAMQCLVPPPAASRLWFDDGHIAFLREDLADQAAILDNNATAIQKLIQSGYEPDAAIEAVVNNDFSRLEGHHTGLFSVQLQPPLDGTMPNPDLAAPSSSPSPNGQQPQPVAN